MNNNNKKNKILKVIFASALLMLFFFAGYEFGIKYGKGGYPPVYVKNSDEDKPADVDFALFWQTWNKFQELYHGKTDSLKMLYGAISGMVASAGDPYTVFLTPEETKSLSADLSGEFQGIGAELTEENGIISVISPLTGSPAEKAGIKPKDLIIEIDGISTAEMSLDAAVNKIRGAAGSEVKLKIQHKDNPTIIDLKIVRDNIKVSSVRYELITAGEKKIAVVKISQFGDDTLDLMKNISDKIKSDNARGIVLDLRNNPGGYLESSVSVSNIFLERDKVVVLEVDKNGNKTPYKTKDEPSLKNLPLVVLINNGSASAAEIVTGAIKDNGRGKVIGEKSFGKGSVQQIEPLSGGSALKVTIANWLTPNGTAINKVGVSPDITVESPKGKTDVDSQFDVSLKELLLMIK